MDAQDPAAPQLGQGEPNSSVASRGGRDHTACMSRIRYARDVASSIRSADHIVVVGTPAELKSVKAALPEEFSPLAADLSSRTSPGLQGRSLTASVGPKKPLLTVVALPSTASRYSCQAGSIELANLMRKVLAQPGSKVAAIVLARDEAFVLPRAVALCRPLTGISRKRNATTKSLTMCFQKTVGRTGVEALPVAKPIREVVTSVRLAADLVDGPPSEMNPTAMAAAAREALDGLAKIKVREIKGDALLRAGLGGIHGVGRTAVEAPRLLIAEYSGGGRSRTAKKTALVGKGVTFDTGGLHLKARGTMEGMKSDMGGAAAVLGAFRACAAVGVKKNLVLLLALAENAIGPAAVKPDDILTLHSELTVEVNNTDAEGRLLLADATSYAARKLGVDTIIDAATLTGAQGVATGRAHGALISNDAELESLLVRAGYAAGDLVHPLPFAPELYRQEFDSPIADMKNSVRNRMNAQVSCAAEFIHWHISDTGARWAHIDLASPAFIGGRGTGFGVSTLVEAIGLL